MIILQLDTLQLQKIIKKAIKEVLIEEGIVADKSKPSLKKFKAGYLDSETIDENKKRLTQFKERFVETGSDEARIILRWEREILLAEVGYENNLILEPLKGLGMEF